MESKASLSSSRKKDRFHNEKIVPIDNASVLHFENSGSGRDRYGNRIFTSNLGYLDREDHPVKAAILVSKAGEKFIAANIGILNAIDFGLRTLTPEAESYSEKVVDLGRGREMKMLNDPKNNGNNLAYLLTVGHEKYVIKVKKTKISVEIERDDVSQPYINEMLQVQEMEHDIGSELRENGLELPQYLFASGHMSCSKFEEGDHPSSQILREQFFDRWGRILITYLEKMINSGASLWKNIHLDAHGRGHPALKRENFILRDDGKIVFIDPFYYFKYIDR